MAKRITAVMRSDERFAKEIKDMQLKRVMKGKDKMLKPTKTSRITLAITRHKLFPLIKKDIIDADLP